MWADAVLEQEKTTKQDSGHGLVGASVTVEIGGQNLTDDQWFACLEEMGCSEPSLTPGYFGALSLAYKSTGIQPRVVIAKRADRIVALAICLVGESRIQFGIGDRVLFSIPRKAVILQRTALSAMDQHSARSVVQALTAVPHQMVIVEPYASFGLNGERLELPGNRYASYLPDGRQESCSLAMIGSWERYVRRLTKKVRHELRRKLNRINRKYGESATSLERFQAHCKRGMSGE